MKKTTATAIIFFSFLFMAKAVFACEPCIHTLNLKETSEKSDLIIIGQRTDFSSREKDSRENPDTINVKILKILKGKTEKDQIDVNSWDGICTYGIVVDDKKYIMLLEERDGIYDAVDFGCSAKTFLVEGDLVDYNGSKISIDTFAKDLGLINSTQTANAESEDKTSVFYYVFLALIILIFSAFLLFKKIKK